ncbi:MAG: hypothetical protein HY741_05660 [Chloroflexi bacterium]|nr:hypothetical protein [Chloroflexota bacterium]
MVLVIYGRVLPEELRAMLPAHGKFIKLAVDVERNILAGGGALHADCEAELLELGSDNDNIWGADWYPFTQELQFEAMLNIRPRLGNRTQYLQSPVLRAKITTIVDTLLRGVYP